MITTIFELEGKMRRYLQIIGLIQSIVWEISECEYVHWHFNYTDNKSEMIYTWEQFHAADVKCKKKFNKPQLHDHPYYPQKNCKICKKAGIIN